MKKTILILVIALVIAVPTNAFGHTSEQYNIVPQYVDTNYSMSDISIDSRGKINIKVTSIISVNSSVNKIICTVKLINAKDGNTKYTWNNVTLDRINEKEFYFERSHLLFAKGDYYASYTLKLYDNNELIETISGKTYRITYS